MQAVQPQSIQAVRPQIIYIDADPRNHHEISTLFASKLSECETTCFRNIDSAVRREEHVKQHQVVIYGADLGDGPGVLAMVGLTLRNRFHVAKTILFVSYDPRADKMNFDHVVGQSDFDALTNTVAKLLPKQAAEQTA